MFTPTTTFQCTFVLELQAYMRQADGWARPVM